MRFDIETEFKKALRFHRKGDLKTAGQIYGRILEANPDHADALHLMGVIASEAGNFGLAVKLMERAVQRSPGEAVYHNNLGNAYKGEGSLDKALQSYARAFEIRPDFAAALVSMGSVHKDLGHLDEAMGCLQKALKLKGDFADAYYNMAIVLKARDRIDEAVSCYEKCLRLNPGFSDAYFNLGAIYRETGRPEKAVACYKKALEISPFRAGIHYNLGVVQQEGDDLEEAFRSYERAIQLDPAHVRAYNNLAVIFKETGRPDMARDCYRKSFQISPNAGVRIQKALVFPVVFESEQDILLERERLGRDIDRLMDMKVSLKDPAREVGTTGFYLAYHGLNNRDLQERLARLFVRACPDLAWVSPNCGQGHQPGGRIRIGVVSRFFCRHTIGRLNAGIIAGLSREKFQVKLFRFAKTEDSLTREIDRAADEAVILPDDLSGARDTIAGHTLDILFYPEIGMDPLTYFLAFSRLAPVQCTTWGHPVTTGIPNMDYYLSPADAEPAGATRHYSESLVPMKKFPMFCPRPEIPENPLSRKRHTLSKDAHLYVCPQTLFKFHPDFDEALGHLLREDPKGTVVLFETKKGRLAKLLGRRFMRTLPDVMDRIRFLPRMTSSEYLSFLTGVDVLLDTPHFTGGFTSLLAFAFGIPIVTWPGRFMCGRLTLGLYRQTGVMDCVADHARSYADIAIRLANDGKWREEIRNRILEGSLGLYGNMAAVHELEHFFENAARDG